MGILNKLNEALTPTWIKQMKQGKGTVIVTIDDLTNFLGFSLSTSNLAKDTIEIAEKYGYEVQNLSESGVWFSRNTVIIFKRKKDFKPETNCPNCKQDFIPTLKRIKASVKDEKQKKTDEIRIICECGTMARFHPDILNSLTDSKSKR